MSATQSSRKTGNRNELRTCLSFEDGMEILRPMRRLLCLALSLLLAACGVESDNPIAPPEKTIADTRLEGVWKSVNSDDYLHFATQQHSQGMDFVVVEHGKGLKVSRFLALPTVIGGVHFFSMIDTQKERGKKQRYAFMRYAVSSENVLSLWGINQEAVERAIKTGRLKGKIHVNSKDKNDRDAIITDSSENIAKFIGSQDARKLFDSPPTKYRKISSR